ncbi:MAG: ATP-binding protein [Planctomycetes bacterium]|nr:ATP-binding protein [Planctomycetota bacterium]
MIQRTKALAKIRRSLAESPICALLGPRQCGKTTLAKQFARRRSDLHYFDLESVVDRARLQNPERVLSELHGLVIIDEIQKQPELFTVLRPLVDRSGCKTRFLILGSASPGLVRGVSESLAGRVSFVDLAGFDLEEVGSSRWKDLWLRGSFPRSFLATSERGSLRWRMNYIRTFLERDLPQLGVTIPSESMRRFWMMLAHFHGQIWNAAELARSLGVSENTARRYLEILTGAYMVSQLQPWWVNIGKRQYKSPKVYLRDSGILHGLLGIESHDDLIVHPKYGASWEGFALDQILRLANFEEAYFWGTHSGAELDLLVFHRGRPYGVEFKCSEAPALTKSLQIAIEDLKLERGWIVYPGSHTYPVHEKVEAIPLSEFRLRSRNSLFRP